MTFSNVHSYVNVHRRKCSGGRDVDTQDSLKSAPTSKPLEIPKEKQNAQPEVALQSASTAEEQKTPRSQRNRVKINYSECGVGDDEAYKAASDDNDFDYDAFAPDNVFQTKSFVKKNSRTANDVNEYRDKRVNRKNVSSITPMDDLTINSVRQPAREFNAAKNDHVKNAQRFLALQAGYGGETLAAAVADVGLEESEERFDVDEAQHPSKVWSWF